MRQIIRRKARYAPKRPQPPARKIKSLGPRELRALRKTELVSLVQELRAQLAVRAEEAGSKAMPGDGTVCENAARSEGATAPARATSLVINGSVRSGQIIDFPGGDVTVIGSVASGAEIVAGGSIHVYGTLRGRAFAGTSGDQEARIFCRNLQAELLSIDGRYRVAENFDPKLRCRPIQAHLDGMKMALAPLDDSEAPSDVKVGGASIQRRATERFKNLISMGSRMSPALEMGAR